MLHSHADNTLSLDVCQWIGVFDDRKCRFVVSELMDKGDCGIYITRLLYEISLPPNVRNSVEIAYEGAF